MKIPANLWELYRSNYDGYCGACDEITQDGGVEPDAHNLKCGACESYAVVGIEYATERGLIEIEE